MEEWVGRQWHRFITRAAGSEAGRHEAAAVDLSEMRRAIELMFRAGGGAAAVRLAEAGVRAQGGPRDWLQRLAGTGTQVRRPRLEPEVLSLPPRLAVLAERSLNRALYLWLAALAAALQETPPTGDWIEDNLRASRRALVRFPGLQPRLQRLLAAQLAARPPGERLNGRAARAERAVAAALRSMLDGAAAATPLGPARDDAPVRPDEVAPVWLWIETQPAPAQPALARPDPADADDEAAAQDRHPERSQPRRHAQAVADERNAAPLLMFFRAESILSWGEFVRVNRADDDEPDDAAGRAADEMTELAIAPDGRRSASRVRFDLDLPSAAADDRPLGPGQRLPEWHWKTGRLVPDHCAVQCLVAREAAPFRPSPALRATARRVRRRLEALRAAPVLTRARPDGDEIDLDAWVRHRIDDARHPVSEAPAVFLRRERHERSLATLLLADLSLSTDAHVGDDTRVIDVIRDALHVFGEALSGGGDAFEMLGFSSVRRHNVRIQHLKGFDEPWDETVRARVGAIRPGYYTRIGAAIRHATLRLSARPERQRLLLLLTDGKPNDIDHYEGRHGLEDTRHAVQAARDAGLTPFCVTIDEQAQDYLPMLFGQNGYARVHRPQELVHRLAQIHAALVSR